MLGGGWDISTLNIIMASTNAGKSLWMQNFAVKSADMGYNVLYITLEMSERKVLKRLGSMDDILIFCLGQKGDKDEPQKKHQAQISDGDAEIKGRLHPGREPNENGSSQ